jgi:hypothetical protein
VKNLQKSETSILPRWLSKTEFTSDPLAQLRRGPLLVYLSRTDRGIADLDIADGAYSSSFFNDPWRYLAS